MNDPYRLMGKNQQFPFRRITSLLLFHFALGSAAVPAASHEGVLALVFEQ